MNKGFAVAMLQRKEIQDKSGYRHIILKFVDIGKNIIECEPPQKKEDEAMSLIEGHYYLIDFTIYTRYYESKKTGKEAYFNKFSLNAVRDLTDEILRLGNITPAQPKHSTSQPVIPGIIPDDTDDDLPF